MAASPPGGSLLSTTNERDVACQSGRPSTLRPRIADDRLGSGQIGGPDDVLVEGQELKVSKSYIWLFCIFLGNAILSFREMPFFRNLPTTKTLRIARFRLSSPMPTSAAFSALGTFRFRHIWHEPCLPHSHWNRNPIEVHRHGICTDSFAQDARLLSYFFRRADADLSSQIAIVSPFIDQLMHFIVVGRVRGEQDLYRR